VEVVSTVHGVPPGRAGRIWLTRRLETARRGGEHLDRKLRILMRDHERMRILATEARSEWQEACAEADSWLLRMALLGGEDAIRVAAAPRLLQVDVTWATEMGLTYPTSVVVVPGSEVTFDGGGSAALAPTVAAFRRATLAGARCAAAEEAVRRLEEEVSQTRRRLRAVSKRWLPWLQEALRERDLVLQQAEQDDGIRTRRALDAATTKEASR
jgi:V/A-type H+-transporting ATPase subunit D